MRRFALVPSENLPSGHVKEEQDGRALLAIRTRHRISVTARRSASHATRTPVTSSARVGTVKRQEPTIRPGLAGWAANESAAEGSNRKTPKNQTVPSRH